jgi:hypothetical protein
VCFYSFCFYSQTKTALFILFEINRVQLVHKGLTGFGAVILEEVRRKPRAVRRLAHHLRRTSKYWSPRVKRHISMTAVQIVSKQW